MRTDFIKSYLASNLFAVCPNYMNGIVAIINSGEVAKETIGTVSPSHSYEVKGNVAVISLDGAMTKKNTFIGAICGGFTSYDILSEYINKAEADSRVDTILFDVDTAGGEVAGADEVGEKIFDSSKKTVTFYNNLGASAGIWIFSASDEVYSNETAMIGSIGVMAGYREPEDDGTIALVSKNAQNKSCSLNGDCKQKIQQRIDAVEDIFYARVTRNTGLAKNHIAQHFGYGDVVSASDAVEVGFVKSITTFDKLLKSLQVLEANPTVSDDNSKNLLIGADMKFDRENLDETEANFNALVANRTTLQGRSDSLSMKLETAETALEAKGEEVKQLKATHATQLSEAEGNFKAEIATRGAEAVASGCNAETVVAMMSAGSSEDASAIALKANESTSGTLQADVDANQAKEQVQAEFAASLAKKYSV